MRPLSVTIEGLRSFRSPVEIDFAGRDHIAVIGDTGAGKSSILEAMTYALFGKTSVIGQTVQELMNDSSDKMRVVLTFRVSGRQWEVARTARRDGKGQVKGAGVQLRGVDDDGSVFEQVEQAKKVSARIEELIGLDSDAFLRTVILPQGRFARLLVEDGPTDRSRILRQLWPTTDLEAAGVRASEELQVARETRARLEQAASEYPDDPEAHLAELEARGATAEASARASSEVAKEASDAQDTLNRAKEDAQTARDFARGLEREVPKIGEAREHLARITEALRKISREDERLKLEQTGVRDELARLPTDDGPGRQEVADALAALRTLDGLAEAAVRAAGELRERLAVARDQQEAAREAKDAAGAAEERQARHAELRTALEEAVQSAREKEEAATRRYDECARLAQARASAAAARSPLRERHSELSTKIGAASDARDRADKAAAEAADRLAKARRANSAAAAAHGLCAGDNCPVCQRDLPEGWVAPRDTGLEDARAAAKEARHAAGEAAEGLASTQAKLEAVRQQLQEAEDVAEAAQGEFRAALEELVAEFGPSEAEESVSATVRAALPDPESLIGPLTAERKAASDALAGHDKEHEALAKESTGAALRVAKAETSASGAEELASSARRAAQTALDGLSQRIRGIPLAYRPEIALPDDPADLREVDATAAQGLIAAATERERVLDYRDQRRGELTEKREQIAEARGTLAHRRSDEVETPLGRAAATLTPLRDLLVMATNARSVAAKLQPDTRTRLPGAPAAKHPGAVDEWIGGLEAVADDLRQAVPDLERSASERQESAQATLRRIGHQLGVEGSDSGQEVADAAEEAARAARFHAQNAAGAAREFAAIKDDVLELRALLDESIALELALGDLDKALKAGAFPKWLTLRRSRALLVHASRMLEEISNGKYAFVDPGEAEGDWRVLDKDSGQPRSPASLSGGEQFIASLALALGMVEMMARSGGRLESLFLDEGFGALDRNNLDAAVEALGAVAATGRMVGVISHIGAVAEQLNHVLAVTRTHAGTRAKWLSREERSDLSRADAEGAVAGLLD